LEQARDRIESIGGLLSHTDARLDALTRYRDAYRRYFWRVSSLADLKLAPFHLLANEGQVHADKPHIWHMEMLRHLCGVDPQLLLATPFRQADLNDPASCEEAIAWWAEMTSAGNEGMVVKPLNFISKARRVLV
jgi:protein phosphatase